MSDTNNQDHEVSMDSLDKLTDAMHDAQKKRTLEEQVAYLKSKGIDPTKTYAKWDDDKEDDWDK